uniref:PH domain-containing protein n=1 Tax=Macrostomum lignano TaxID=282301 RepID=A0A1I8H087_9PLAT
MEFQTQCQELISKADNLLNYGESKEADLTQWIDWFDQCSSQLRQLQDRFEGLSRMASEMASSVSPEALPTARAKLREAMDAGNLAETKVAFDQLALVEREVALAERMQKCRRVSAPSTASTKHMQQFARQLLDLGDEMERPFLEAVHGNSAILQPNAGLKTQNSKPLETRMSEWIWRSFATKSTD